MDKYGECALVVYIDHKDADACLVALVSEVVAIQSLRLLVWDKHGIVVLVSKIPLSFHIDRSGVQKIDQVFVFHRACCFDWVAKIDR